MTAYTRPPGVVSTAVRSRDLLHVRAETPGCLHRVHFNNAGSALCTRDVLKTQQDYLEAESLYGGYETVESQDEALQRPYTELAAMLHCSPRNIAILQSATAAWMQVFYGIPFQQDDRILTGVHEYAANFIAFLQVAKRTGATIEVIPEDADSDVDLGALEKSILRGDRKPALLAFTHIPTNSGRVYSAEAIGAVAKRHGVPFLLDACQSIGQMPLNVCQIGCDWLSGTSRKYLRGPRGVGFLYASDEAMRRFEPGTLDMYGAQWTAGSEYAMREDAKRYEQYEKSFAAVAGLGVAVQYANELGMEWIWERVQSLAAELRRQLSALQGVRVHDKGKILCGIVSFTKDGVAPEKVKAALLEKGINVNTSPMSSTRMDFERNNLPDAVVRASVHYYNTEEEVCEVVAAVSEIN